MFCRTFLAIALFAASLTAASRNLDIYWIDAEGGASTLIVSPSGQSLLVDTANRTPDDRDAKRIFAVREARVLGRHPAAATPPVQRCCTLSGRHGSASPGAGQGPRACVQCQASHRRRPSSSP